jgi:adenosylcobinamide amidohydrolase
MCELYAAQQLQIPGPGVDWKSWAAGLKTIDAFANEAVPEPYNFDDWQEWAEAVVNAVNPRVN